MVPPEPSFATTRLATFSSGELIEGVVNVTTDESPGENDTGFPSKYTLCTPVAPFKLTFNTTEVPPTTQPLVGDMLVIEGGPAT